MSAWLVDILRLLTLAVFFVSLSLSIQAASPTNPDSFQIKNNVSITTSTTNSTKNCLTTNQTSDRCDQNETYQRHIREHKESWHLSNTPIGVLPNRPAPSYPQHGGRWTYVNRSNEDDFYIMTYEASKANTSTSSPKPVSKKAARPWNHISQEEAKRACKRLGDQYELPSNNEWQAAVNTHGERRIGGNTDGGGFGMNTTQTCRLAQGTAWNVNYCLTGTGPATWKTRIGAEDMIGNLWEWTSTVLNTTNMRFAGESGYIEGWSQESLWPTDLTEKRNESLQGSWFFASNGTYAVRRGGDWSTTRYSGPYTISVDRHPSDKRNSIGFRCIYHPE